MTGTGGKGPDLEEILKAYFWEAGYFVARGLPFRCENEDITDVDLWLYERPSASTRRRLIVDIKNKKSPKVSERLLWTAGLKSALRADGAVVATTDSRPAARSMAKRLGLILFDGNAVAKLSRSAHLQSDSLRAEEFDSLIRKVDNARKSSSWRDEVRTARSSILTGLGFQSANACLLASGHFAQSLIESVPGSSSAEVALRALLSCSALAAIGLDYALSEYAFASADDRRRAMTNGIRYGHPEDDDALGGVRLASRLAEHYLPGGKRAGRLLEQAFLEDAAQVNAEVFADYLSRLSVAESLFATARNCEKAATSRKLLGFDEMPSDSKAFLGLILDFHRLPRDRVALAWSSGNANGAYASSPQLPLVGGD